SIEYGDLMMVPKTGDTMLRPAVPGTGTIAEPIEHARDPAIGQRACEVADDVDDLAVGAVAMVTLPIVWDDECRMLPAGPVHEELDLRLRLGADGGDDFFNQETDHSLLDADIVGTGPDGGKFFGQCQQALAVGRTLLRGRGRDRREPLLERLDSLERGVPAPLQRLRDQPMLRLDRVVLAARAVSLVLGLAQLQLDRAVRGRVFVLRRRGAPQGGLDCAGAEHAEQLPFDRLINAQAAEGNAPTRAVVERGTPTAVARHVARRPRVADVQPASAVATPQQSGQQTRPSADGPSHHEPFHLRVLRNERPVPLVDVPGNIRLVMIAHQG